MDRRTFLQATGLTAVATTAGCGSLVEQTSSSGPEPAGNWQQATGSPGNTSWAPAVDISGRNWSVSVPDRPVSSPVAADGVAIVGTADGALLAVDLATGEQRWHARVSGVQGTPAIVDNWVVVAADDGRLHRFALDDGASAGPMLLGTSMISPVTAADGHAFVTVAPNRLVSVDVESWRIEWKEAFQTRSVGKPAVDTAHGQVVVSGTRADGSGLLRVLDVDTGANRWRAEFSKGLGPTPVHTGVSVLVAGSHRNRLQEDSSADESPIGGVFWFDTDGDIQRTETLDPPIWKHCTIRFLASRDDWSTVSGCNGLVAHGLEDVKWSTTQSQGIITRPLITPDGVLIGDSHGQFWMQRPDGKSQVVSVGGIPSTPAVLERGLLVAADRRLHAFG